MLGLGTAFPFFIVMANAADLALSLLSRIVGPIPLGVMAVVPFGVPPAVYGLLWLTRYSRHRVHLREDAIAFEDHRGRVTEIPWGRILLCQGPSRKWHRPTPGLMPWKLAEIHGRETPIRCWVFPEWHLVEAAVGAALQEIDRWLAETV
jgi:hypothetical protein